jgi:hypothetical protein
MRHATTWELDQAVEHCRRHIERNRSELQRREKIGHDTSQVATRLKTLEALKAVHEADRDRLQFGRA